MKNKIYVTITSIMLMFILGIKFVSANDDVGFTVNPVIPNTQLDFSKGFFFIKTKPGEQQKLIVKLSNIQEEPITVKISVDDAISTEHGIVNFSQPLIVNETQKDPLSEIVKIEEEEVTIQGNETKDIVFEVNPPTNSYDGIKWAALRFTANDNNGEKVNKMVAVDNEYQIGLITSETGEDYNNGETLELLDVKAVLSNGRKVIEAQISNPEPKIVENLFIKAELIDKKDNKVVKTKDVNNYAFAPNSTMPFVFDWGLSNLVSGEYILKMNISNDENQWNLEKTFKLSEKDVKKVNDASPVKITTPKWMKITTVVLGIYVVISGIVIKVRQKKWQKEIKKSKKRKNRKRGK